MKTPMRLLITAALFTALAVLCGCKSTTYSRTEANGETVKFRDTRWFLNTSAEVSFTAGTNGTKALKVSAKSDVNTEALKAVAEGVAIGLAKGAKPAP
jgi:hypothetical protein